MRAYVSIRFPRLAWIIAISSVPSSLFAQQPAQETAARLSVERIFTRPGLALPLARGVAWSPDGKWLSFLQTTGTGASEKTDLYVVDPTKPNEPPRVLVGSDKLRELMPASRRRDTQATGLARFPAQPYQ